MARLSYPDLSDPAIAPLAERIKAERGGKMLKLYHMLLNSPPVADGWRAFLTAIRQQCQLPGRPRELAILRVAVINHADYEFNAHVPFAMKESVTQAQIDDMRADRVPAGFTDADRAVLALTDAMTRHVEVPEATFNAVKKHYPDREVMELVATVAAYNLVSRFLVAIQVDHE
jgi:alkylhydroperoxidase family enzyme